MKGLQRILLVALALSVTACTSVQERDYEACIVGSSALGGLLGTATGGTLAGVAVGAGAGAVICQYEPPAKPASAPMAAAAAADSDGDGVLDGDDRCPGTPSGVEVDTAGCPIDDDGDGVPDYLDDCPNTPRGVAVDARGCPLEDEVLLTVDRMNFAFDSAELDSRAKAALDAAVAVIRGNSAAKLDVIGYTDTSGPAAYNQRLSERRAQAAVDYLVAKGVDASQLRAVGRGEADPVASNDTRAGREQNRRVELVVR